MRTVFGAVLLVAAVGHWFLLIFGEAFTGGYTAMLILCAAHVVNAAGGCVGVILTMSGHERAAAVGLAVTVVLNITLNAVLIPRYGMTGAAAASLVSELVKNIILGVICWRTMGIDPTVLGRSR